MTELGFIGGGNMAAALIGGLLQQGHRREQILVAETNPARRAWLAETFGLDAVERAEDVLSARVIVLAIKPQQMPAVLCALPPLPEDGLVLSIAAGVRAADISRWLGGHQAVVRAMPNTPALVGAGIAGLYAMPGVSEAQKQAAEAILRAVGEVVWVADETQIDAVTAISGSGPAYVFYFIEALEQAASELGLPAEAARKLTVQTFFGAAALALKDGGAPEALRARVTSKGGTTERGLIALEEGGVKYAIGLAARAAALRAAEIGELLGKDAC